MSKRLPSELRIGPHLVPVRQDPLPKKQLGETKWDPGPTIRLRAGLPKHLQAMTLVHELAHVMADTHGWGWEEEQVLAFEAVFCAVLQRNPHLLTYLQDAFRQ